MEVKYFKDLNHNYMVVTCNYETNNQYQYKMLEHKVFPGFLPCKLRHLNGERFLYYEINSRQTMENIFNSRELTRDEITQFFCQLKSAVSKLEEYLLEPKCIVLSPKYIYMDISLENYYFMYLPYYSSDENQIDYSELADFLIDKLDTKDDELTDLLYSRYDQLAKGNFIIDDLIEMLGNSKTSADTNTSQNLSIIGNSFEDEISQQFQNIVEPGGEALFLEKLDEKERKETKKTGKWFLFLMGLGLWGVGILGFVMFFFSLSEIEFIACLSGTVVCALGSIVMLIIFILYRRKTNLIVQEELPQMERSQIPEASTVNYTKMQEHDVASVQNRTVNNIGQTVFMENTLNFTEYKLHGMGRKNKYHIDLTKLPLTVGKLAGSVDMVLNDDSVSRMHVRFEKMEDEVYMVDLNSTNGTYHNGIRLEPHNKILLEVGDEVRIGALRFHYC